MTFEWRFDRIAGGTKLAQRIALKGKNAAVHVAGRSAVCFNLAAGMNRIISAIERAEASGTTVVATSTNDPSCRFGVAN